MRIVRILINIIITIIVFVITANIILKFMSNQLELHTTVIFLVVLFIIYMIVIKSIF